MTDHHEQMVRGFLDALHVSDPDFAVLTEGLLAEDARYVPLLPPFAHPYGAAPRSAPSWSDSTTSTRSVAATSSRSRPTTDSSSPSVSTG
uniref:Uncharacterized protein n=1 Tax=Janibacter limosus TaxID=53458 RepID=A0AC61U5B3_9MICO|nr:hypothetical protein [Janibacter limosus]